MASTRSPQMESTAIARFIRQSPRKVRLIADLVRGLPVAAALDQLRVSRKEARKSVEKLLLSAIANAGNKGLDKKALFVKTIMVDGGPVLKRSRARAFGRSAPIYHRTCHISVVLAERGGVMSRAAAVEAIAAGAPKSIDHTVKAPAKKRSAVPKKAAPRETSGQATAA